MISKGINGNHENNVAMEIDINKYECKQNEQKYWFIVKRAKNVGPKNKCSCN